MQIEVKLEVWCKTCEKTCGVLDVFLRNSQNVGIRLRLHCTVV